MFLCLQVYSIRAYRSVFRLRNEEIYRDGLERAPKDEDDIGLPANTLERNGPRKLVQ